ncbi:MAG: CoB--CoM heterodisulfide reductase iron-sulfur subunit B family protein [Phycisphaerae bacterium]|nr:CoB--CoM heterodisulfide reductase iron-sulfur subunit B family protein [Phycisphaerae bacterium]
MRFGFFPGCSQEGSSREYQESLREVASRLGIELAEIPDWNCCGATAAHTLNHRLALALPARTLALAEQAGLDEVVVPCSACYNRLAGTRHELLHDEALRQQITDIIEMNWHGATRILNVLEWLNRVAGELPGHVSAPFGHRVACYYGCYLTRPKALAACRRIEDPIEMDELVRAVGAEPIRWAYKVECCGAGLSVSRTESVARLSERIVSDAVERGAEAIVVACPMCHTNLDLRRDAILAAAPPGGRSRLASIPVLYISQVIGLAMGVSPRPLGLHRHHVPVRLSAAPPSVAPVAPGEGEE